MTNKAQEKVCPVCNRVKMLHFNPETFFFKKKDQTQGHIKLYIKIL